MKSKEELKKYYKINEEGNRIEVVFFRHLDSDEDQIALAKQIDAEVREILASHPKKNFTMLVNLSPLEQWPTKIPQKAQRKYLAISRYPQIRKAAIVGYETSINFQTKFVLWLIKMNGRIHWFSNIETAEEWLREG